MGSRRSWLQRILIVGKRVFDQSCLSPLNDVVDCDVVVLSLDPVATEEHESRQQKRAVRKQSLGARRYHDSEDDSDSYECAAREHEARQVPEEVVDQFSIGRVILDVRIRCGTTPVAPHLLLVQVPEGLQP